MKVIEVLQAMGERLQIALVVGSVPTDNSGKIKIIYANNNAASLFGYTSSKTMESLDVRSLMPEEIAKDHHGHVSSYVERANGGSIRVNSIMGSWRNVNGVKKNGSLISLKANVADIRNSEERYFVAIFMDRTEDERREKEYQEALGRAKNLAEEAEKARFDADVARKAAEEGLLKQKKLSGQITLLRQIFAGTMGLVVMLGVLVVASWLTGTTDKDALSMIERVLLVLTGILGSAMASVFDSRNKDS